MSLHHCTPRSNCAAARGVTSTETTSLRKCGAGAEEVRWRTWSLHDPLALSIRATLLPTLVWYHEGPFCFPRQDHDDRTLGEWLPFDHDLAANDGTSGELHERDTTPQSLQRKLSRKKRKSSSATTQTCRLLPRWITCRETPGSISRRRRAMGSFGENFPGA